MEVLCEKLTELFDLLEHEVLPKPRNLTKDEEHDSLSISSFPWSMSENGLNILNTLCFTLLEFDGLGLVCTHDQSSLLRRLIQRLMIVLRETKELTVRSRLIKACFPILLKHSNISQVFEDKKEEGFEVLGVELWNLSLAFSPSDLDNSSSLLCIVSKECASRCSLFARQTSFYPLLILFFKHPLAYIRRRGAFLLSSAVPINSSSISSDSSLLQNSGRKGKRHWIFDFMDCYELIENSSSLHLVKQVEPYLLHLFAINVDYTVAYSCSSSSSAYPPISFDWPSILFHCLLQAPIPSLRKYAIQLLFTNQLPLSLTPPTIEWLCYTILPAIDSTMYFPPNLVAVESVNSATFPGVLFPLFLSHHLSSTNTSEGTEHLKLFLRSFLKSLCEMSSLCAIKYLLSAFGNTTTLSSLPRSSIPVSLLHDIRNFITRKLSLTNSLVRAQVLQSLLPLVVTCLEPTVDCLFALIALLAEDMPLDKSLSLVGGLLQTYTRHVLIVPEGTPGELESNLKKILLPTGQEKLYSVLAIACCLFSYNDKDTSSTPMCPVLAVFTSALTTAVSLYYSVYADAKTQRQSIWLLHGISVVTCALREKSKALILRSTNLSQLLLPLLSQCATTLDFLLASVLRILRNFENGKKEDFGSMLGTSLQDMDATSVAIGGLSLLPTLDRSTRTSLLTSLLSFLSQHLQPRLIDNATTSADAIPPTRLLSLLIPNVHRLILLQQEEGGALSPSDSDVISATFFALFDCTKNLTPSNFRIIMSDESSNKLSRLLKDSGYHHFGHCNSMLLSCRWHAASACLDTHVSSFPSLSSTLGVLHERFLAQLANHIETSPTAALPPLMSIAKKAIRWKLALHPANLDATLKEVSFLLEAAWLAVLSDEYVPLVGINSYISLSLDASLVSSTPASFVLLYFDRIFGYGCMNRPHVVQSLLCHLCLTLFQEDPSLCLPFLPRIRDMLLYKEPKGDDNSVPDYEDTMGEVGLVCRLLLLQFFESIELPSPTFLPNKESVFRSGMEALIRDLILMNTQGPFVKASMIGTEIFGQKIRSWQSLCVLSRFVSQEMATSLLPDLFTCLQQVCAHGIRVYMEIFAAVLATTYTSVFLPALLLHLKGFNHPQQTLASYFIILGYLFINGSSEESNSALHLQGYSNNELREVVLTLSPWLSCSNGLPRAVSQVVVLHLIPMVVESLQREEESSLNAAPPGCPLLSSHLLGIAAYLTTNKDSSKLMKRQMTVFTEATILQRCSVNALLRYKVEGNDEIIPEHLLDIISAFCKHESQEQEAKDGGNLSPSSGMTLDDDTVNSFQIKRTNYEQLQLLLEENGKGSTKRTGNETVKQSLVVVASLLEKATNLAGVARTCEVFGAEKLVVSDAKIVVSDVFQGIAVSAEDWLQIDEVKEDQLVPFLHDYKRRGYSIVGLEQTDSSIDLSQSTTRLPLKCVLLLGKEKEGIPVHLLNELDMCLEIPQLGVIRSLNVHVSAAIAIWEITKQNCFTKNCN